MYACDTCGEEFETLSRLRLDHAPCPIDEEQKRQEEARARLKDERGLEVGDRCRVIAGGREVDIVDVEPNDDGEPRVVWVPAGEEDDPENRETSAASELV